ncbi:MAG: cell wall metabolism sensor histidine kinase WalK, partial [Clostridiaceae bacterium]|nr:cell wall metabolism sensor histidine kinase WalK [Clostridiaceae bacterium]
SYTSTSDPQSQRDIDEAKELIQKHNYAIMNRRITSFQDSIGKEDTRYLFVGYPIVASDVYSQNQSTIGSVYILSSLDEIRESFTSLNFALILASCIAFLIMLTPLLFATQKLLAPLIETKNVAQAMTRGDFSQRANTNSRDEIGDLARAVNNLADDLDRTLNNLMAERNRLQQILNGLSEGILAVGDKQNLIHINPALLRLFSVEEKTDHEAYEAIRSISALEEPLERVIRSKGSEYLMVRQRSRSIAVQIDSLLDSAGHTYGAVALFRDTTEAEQLEQTRRDYVSNVSHELRTPLTAVRGLVEPLADGIVKREEDRQRYYGIILQETLRLSRLIDDMMALSRLQAGTVSLEPERVSARDLMEVMQYKYKLAMENKGIDFVLPLAGELLPDLYMNEDRLEQILVILLDNAMKFTERGGKISLDLKPYPRDASRRQFVVSDTGTGIAPEEQDFIFDRFYKVNKSRGRSEGTGLGLSIAHELCEQMGESIWVRSKEGEGSSFYFTVRLYKEGIEHDNE